MFYFLSKFLFFLIQPLNWLIGLALYVLFGKHKKRKRRALRLLVGLLIFFTNPLIFNFISHAWEPEPVAFESIETPYDVAIVLGGYSNLNVEAINDRLNLSPSGNRLVTALELYYQGKAKKLLLSGGSGNIIGHEENEAQHVARFLRRLGIPESDIIIEDKARNTRENMTYTKEILTQRFPNARCLILTSAFHIRRSMACAEKVGIKGDPFPADFWAERYELTPSKTIIPDPELLAHWQKLIKEWIGYVVYDLRGYI